MVFVTAVHAIFIMSLLHARHYVFWSITPSGKAKICPFMLSTIRAQYIHTYTYKHTHGKNSIFPNANLFAKAFSANSGDSILHFNAVSLIHTKSGSIFASETSREQCTHMSNINICLTSPPLDTKWLKNTYLKC